MNTPSERKEVRLSNSDIDMILKALVLYDRHVSLLNSGVFQIAEDDLSDMNNECEYLKGLIRNLESYKTGMEKPLPTGATSSL